MERPWTDEDRLREKYHGQGMSLSEIAEEWDTGSSTIHSWMDRHGIETRKSTHEKPVHFRTEDRGYEVWRYDNGETQHKVRVHRLACVAWFGFDEVTETTVVHHKDRIPWHNSEPNLELLSTEEHQHRHRRENERTFSDSRLREMLYGECLSVLEIAERLDVAWATVKRYLSNSSLWVDYTPYQDGQVLQYMVNQGHTPAEIGDVFSLDVSTVKQYLWENDVDGWQSRETVSDKYSEESLRTMYFDEGMSMGEIGDEFGVTQGAISQAFDKLDIETGCKTSSPDETPWRDESWMQYHYIELDKSLQQIADEFDCSYGVIQTWVHRHDLR